MCTKGQDNMDNSHDKEKLVGSVGIQGPAGHVCSMRRECKGFICPGSHHFFYDYVTEEHSREIIIDTVLYYIDREGYDIFYME